MQKRFLAILAIIATVFALGVGTATAKPKGDDGEVHRACQKDNPPPGCADDGHPDGPDDGDDDDEGGEGAEPGPQDLCDAIRSLDEGLAPIADGCDAVVAALTGGEEPPAEEPPAEEPPAEEEPPPGLQDLCDGIRDGGAPVELADGCDQVVAGIEGGEEEPPAEEPPAEEPPAEEEPPPGLQDLCDGIRDGGAPVELADGCDQVVAGIEGGEEEPPAEEPPAEEEPPPGLQDLCDGIRDGGAPVELADGCDELVGNIPA